MIGLLVSTSDSEKVINSAHTQASRLVLTSYGHHEDYNTFI